MTRILVIKFRNIGDVLLTTPLIKNLKLNYPSSLIDIAINSNCIDMIQDNPDINNIHLYDRKKAKGNSFFDRILYEYTFLKSIIKNNYDIVLNLTEGDRGAFISFFTNAQTKIGYKPRKGFLKYFNNFNKYAKDGLFTHTINRDLQFLDLLDKKVKEKKVYLFWNNDVSLFVDDLIRKEEIKSFVHIHPVSRWMFKCWEDDRMAKIIDYIEIVIKKKVILTASNEKIELDRIDKILSFCKSKPINLSGQLNLKQLACLSYKADFFFGVDSAPMHMAAAVNTPTLALFGGSEPLYWGAWDNKEQRNYENTNGTQKMGKNTIISNISTEFFYVDEVKKNKGMYEISEQEVMEVIKDYV